MCKKKIVSNDIKKNLFVILSEKSTKTMTDLTIILQIFKSYETDLKCIRYFFVISTINRNPDYRRPT
jgi:hypothetical protein